MPGLSFTSGKPEAAPKNEGVEAFVADLVRPSRRDFARSVPEDRTVLILERKPFA